MTDIDNKKIEKAKLKETIANFKELKENWDSYDGLPILDKEIELAKAFVYKLNSSYLNLNYIGAFPVSNGGVQFEGSFKNKKDKELEFIISFESFTKTNDLIKQTKIEFYWNLGTHFPEYSYYNTNDLDEAIRFFNYLAKEYNKNKISEENFKNYFNREF